VLCWSGLWRLGRLLELDFRHASCDECSGIEIDIKPRYKRKSIASKFVNLFSNNFGSVLGSHPTVPERCGGCALGGLLTWQWYKLVVSLSRVGCCSFPAKTGLSVVARRLSSGAPPFVCVVRHRSLGRFASRLWVVAGGGSNHANHHLNNSTLKANATLATMKTTQAQSV